MDKKRGDIYYPVVVIHPDSDNPVQLVLGDRNGKAEMSPRGLVGLMRAIGIDPKYQDWDVMLELSPSDLSHIFGPVEVRVLSEGEMAGVFSNDFISTEGVRDWLKEIPENS